MLVSPALAQVSSKKSTLSSAFAAIFWLDLRDGGGGVIRADEPGLLGVVCIGTWAVLGGCVCIGAGLCWGAAGRIGT